MSACVCLHRVSDFASQHSLAVVVQGLDRFFQRRRRESPQQFWHAQLSSGQFRDQLHTSADAVSDQMSSRLDAVSGQMIADFAIQLVSSGALLFISYQMVKILEMLGWHYQIVEATSTKVTFVERRLMDLAIRPA